MTQLVEASTLECVNCLEKEERLESVELVKCSNILVERHVAAVYVMIIGLRTKRGEL